MNVLELFRPIRTFAFGVEGVITDNNVYISESSPDRYRINSRDIYAMDMALRKGYRIWVITHNKSEAVRKRLTAMRLPELHFNAHDKKMVLHNLTSKTQTMYSTVLYMADDIPDHAAMKQCGLPCCPADAAEEIKAISRYISPFKGGEGCVRDVIEKVLKLNGDWELPV